MNNTPVRLTDLFERIEKSGNTDIIECGVIQVGRDIFVYPATVDIYDIGFHTGFNDHKIHHTYSKIVIRGIHRYKNMRFNTVTKDITFADGRKLDI